MIAWVLTDIEGTTSSISFVHDVLFPYAKQALPDFVRHHATDSAVQAQLAAVQEACGSSDVEAMIGQLLAWIDSDTKATPLKALQGMVWQYGYENGDFQAHVYPDVVPALQRWQQNGHQLAVYSSGSVKAQHLFFQYSVAGDVRALFSRHYDTTTGMKQEVASYQTIAADLGAAPSDVLFLSDVAGELTAAAAAGMQVCGLHREGNGPLAGEFPIVCDFAGVEARFLR